MLDSERRVMECNPAAATLLDQPRGQIEGGLLAMVIPQQLAAAIQGAEQQNDASAIHVAERWVTPSCSVLPGHNGWLQVILRDVTDEQRRQARLENYSAGVVLAQEDERLHLARELHDETVQAMLVLCRMIQDQAGATREELYRYARSILDSLRAIVRGLRPPALDDLGLTPALERALAEVTARSEVKTQLRVSGNDRRLSPEIELALFRIGQEALHNVERHSHATHVQILLNYTAQSVDMQIADDGDGFDASGSFDDSLTLDKVGLLGMQERARIVGGTVIIHSSPHRGTRVEAVIPSVEQGRVAEQRAAIT